MSELNDSRREQADERRLFRRLTDGELSPVEFRELESRLLDDREFRRRYLRYMGLEGDLAESLHELMLPTVERTSPPNGVARRKRRWSWWVSAAACLLVIGLLAGNLFQDRPVEVVAPAAKWIAAPHLSDLGAVAVIRHIEGTEPQDPLRTGTWLKPGMLELEHGRLELEFVDGAVVTLAAPLELHILSGNSAKLVRGRAVARVPESAHGFTLNAPNAAIVDLGTEFALNVDASGQSDVQVIDGAVEVSLLGDDGATLVSEKLVPSQTFRMSSTEGIRESVKDSLELLPRVANRTPAPLNVSNDYVQAVLDAQPLIYWRFESLEEGRIRNEAGPDYSGVLHGVSEESPAIVIENGQARFTGSSHPRYIADDRRLPVPALESFTLEVWLNADFLHHATLLGLRPAREGGTPDHTSVLELSHRTTLVHNPGAFRFLHRSPPGRSGGINLFSGEGCTPGRWHHLVAVKSPTELFLYLNGKLVRHLENQSSDHDEPFHIVLGQLYQSIPERQFQGLLDEFALYPGALGDEDIRRHHELMHQ